MSHEKYGPHSELSFFRLKKEPVALTKAGPFKHVLPAETLKACALIGLHLMATGGDAGSSGSPSPDLGDNVEIRLPRKPGLGLRR